VRVFLLILCRHLDSFHLLGANREVKKAVEAYWAGKLSAEDLGKAAADVRKTSWTNLKEHNVDLIPRLVVTQII
jgi:hypothetical protein